jgi:transcriptional regulator with XRE-family HTH domain
MAGLNGRRTANDLERRVGEQLQVVRRHRGWSLRELAQASGLSLTTVHQIESGRTSPGLGTLHSLATALGVPLGALLDGQDPAAPAVHVAADARPELEIPGGRIERLATGLASQRIRGLVLTLAPRRATGPAPIVHPGQELVLGLEGVCVYEVAGQRFTLETGDSLLFESSQPHRALNAGSRTSRVLLVLYAPEEEPRWIESHVAPPKPGPAGTHRRRPRPPRSEGRARKVR